MRGVRAKALRLEFKLLHGRAPAGPKIRKVAACGDGTKKKPWIDQVKVARSRWVTTWTKAIVGAAAKTLGKDIPPTAERTNSVGQMFMRQIVGIKVEHPSEWREWKKGYRARLATKARTARMAREARRRARVLA